MIPHLKYLKYVLVHKWFVFLAGFHFGVPLWNSIVHDWSKFLPSEWSAYVNQFHGNQRFPAPTGGYYHNPDLAKAEFNVAWCKHLNRNPHHWQHWLILKPSGTFEPLSMPDRFVREMLADWSGAGAAQGKSRDPIGWYSDNRNKMVLHPDTRVTVEALLGYVGKEVVTPVGY